MDSNTVKSLLALQEIDTKIQEISEKIKLLPKSIETLYKEKESISIHFEQLNKKLKELDFIKKEKELDIQDLNSRIFNVEKALEKVRTNDEYKNLLREKARAEESIMELEDEILSIMEEMEQLKKAIQIKEKEKEEELTRIDERIRKLENEERELSLTLSELKKEREELVKLLKPQEYSQYENIKKRVKTKPIAIVKDATCTGCYMVIPPKVFSELLKTNKMLSCPNCGRYLYYDNK